MAPDHMISHDINMMAIVDVKFILYCTLSYTFTLIFNYTLPWF